MTTTFSMGRLYVEPAHYGSHQDVFRFAQLIDTPFRCIEDLAECISHLDIDVYYSDTRIYHPGESKKMLVEFLSIFYKL